MAMAGYSIRIKRTPGLKQKFHIRIESASAPYEVIFTSEKYRNAAYARERAAHIAKLLHAKVNDETKEG
jgi:hypothetical protein